VTRSQRLLASFVINLLLVIGLLIAGKSAHSTGLVADAGHNLTDAMAIMFALVASLLAARPATERKSFGYHRATILAAFANGLVLIAVTVTIVWLAISRLIHPQAVHGLTVTIAASLSLLANVFVVFLLREGSGDLGIRSALVHSLGDALSAGVVAIAGVVTLVTTGPIAMRIDPIASLIVAGFIVFEAFKITGTSVQVLLEGVPSDIDLESVRRCLCSIAGVASVHDLHVWSLSAEQRALSVHLVIESDPLLSETAGLITGVRTTLTKEFSISHATIEIEAQRCGSDLEHP